MSVADHPLAVAAARAGRNTDSVLTADALGRAIDLRISALAALVSTCDDSRAEIKATLGALGRAAGHEEGGAFGAYWSWYRDGISGIRAAADRLFPAEPWVTDVRGPAWTWR